MKKLPSFKSKFLAHNWDTKLKQLMLTVRIGVVICLLISGLSNSIIGWAVQQTQVSCIEDQGFLLFSTLNTYFCTNPPLASILVTLTAVLCDFLFICSSIRFLFFQHNLRPAVFLITLFSLFAVVRQFIWLRVPEDSCWEDSILPSLLLPPQDSPNFFFSSTTGVIFFFIVENKAAKNWVLVCLSCCALFLVCLSALTLRRDYSVGLLTGVVMGHYVWILSEGLTRKVENWVLVDREKNTNIQ